MEPIKHRLRQAVKGGIRRRADTVLGEGSHKWVGGGRKSGFMGENNNIRKRQGEYDGSESGLWSLWLIGFD